MGYIHLHVHSQMSLLDATIRLEPLADRAKAWGMNAVALTDHGNLFGAVQFMKACEVAGVKPIFGAEMYVADPKSEGRAFHLVLLCRNRDGFANLRTLISRSYLEGLHNGRPTTTREAVARHAGGLVALSGCLGGEVPPALPRGDEAGAMEALEFHRRAFGEDGFWLELEGNDLAEQDAANAALIDLGRRTGTPLVATNNAHYMDREDAVAHAVLVAIDMKRTLNEEQRRNLPLRSFHFASPEEMAARFAGVPEAISNTQRVADMIEQGVLVKEKKLHFPIFATPKAETTAP
ncbi:MAG: PHP domain-containing protein, partial [Deltaproteobacteria bacterium]|nr:PHP domain-containing protein [Deltaproteobacteria bacterium]